MGLRPVLRWAGLNLLAGSVSGSAIAQTVEFTARKAEVDLEQRCAELDGDVEVKSGSLRLRAPRLKIEETADGVGVEGPGRLSGCSCPAPPLELGFERAEISRDGDVDLSGPRLTSGDTTLLYLPRLMLRGPNSAGMLPPTVGYSGRDGAFLGVAAELPLVSSAGQERPGTTRVRLGVGAYSRLERIADGARVSLDVSGPSGRSALAWESLDGGMVDIDAHGASGVVSYRADAARGRRALVGPLAFSRVIAPQDRARLAFASWSPAGSAYAQIRGDSARGLPGIDGAELGASSGYAVDVWGTDVAGLSWEGDLLGVGGATQPGLGVFRQAMALDAGGALGPFAVAVRGEGVLWTRSGQLVGEAQVPGEGSSSSEPSGQAEVRLGLPLSRRFAAWRHWVEPRLAATAQLGRQPWAQGEVALEQRFGAAMAGAPEASLELAAGSLRGEFASGVELDYIRAEIAAGGRWASLGASSVALVDDDPWSTEGALAQSIRARLGSESGLHLRAALDQALGHSWRVLLPGTDALGGSRQSAPSPAPWASPFAALGTSAGGELWLPLGRSFATSVTSVFDVSAGAETPRWLFAAWGGAYRHPCGCLSLQTQLSHRLGRHSGLRTPLEAFDAFVALELFDVSSGG